MQKKTKINKAGSLALGVGMLLSAAASASAAETLNWDKTFPKSDKVTHQKVSFNNRLGIQLIGDLYMPKNMKKNKKYAAIIVGHPFGGVKEQSSGLYAQTLAEKGFVTLAFDASYNGESGGQPRSIASPEAFTEDFSAAVDFIGTRPFVDRNRIGVIGICGSGGFALSAAAVDPRMKAIATISMYDMGRARRQGLGDAISKADKAKNLQAVGLQRWAEYEGAERTFNIGTPEVLSQDAPAAAKEFYSYYRTERGHHPRSTTAMTFTSDAALMNFFPFIQIEDIAPRPILFVAGENANSRYFSEEAHKSAGHPAELYIVPGATHVDLYDQLNFIPFDKLTDFFNKNLK